MKNAYDEKWEWVCRLGQGGQGYTHLVKSRGDQTIAVAKVLRVEKERSLKARGRMKREANNLGLVHALGAKVPAVLGSNLDEWESRNTPLYFVMEHIEGLTLKEHIEKFGPLTVDDALDVVLDLAQSIKKAHEEDILHRDLKPDNIILSEKGPVIVDYGLSFNKGQDDDLTREDEHFGSHFIMLPETRSRGSNHRDPRSDVCALCGVLYFCLSGKNPELLITERSTAPHRRPDQWVSAELAVDPRIRAIELALDRGLQNEILARFQTIDECVARLEMVRNSGGDGQVAPVKPQDLEQELKPLLMRKYRALQLEALAPQAQKVNKYVRTLVAPLNNGLTIFQISLEDGREDFAVPNGIDDLNKSNRITVTLKGLDAGWQSCFTVGAQGSELVLLRGVKTLIRGEVKITHPLQTVLCMPAIPEPNDLQQIDVLLQRTAEEGMRFLADLAPNAQ